MAQTLYTAIQTGSDFNAGTLDSPFKTINFGLARIGAGDTLFVGPGVYPESIENPPMGSGTSWSNKTRVAAYPGETVWLAPSGTYFGILFDIDQSYIEFDGINVDGGNTLLGVVVIGFHNPFPGQPHHIRFQNAEFFNVAGSGVGSKNAVELAAKTPIVTGGIELRYLKLHGGGRPGNTNPDNGYGVYVASPNNLIEYCDVYDNKGCEIHMFNDDGALPDNNTVRNNIIHDETRIGAGPASCGFLIDGSNNQIYNNIIYNIRASAQIGDSDGIAMYSGNGNKLWNNTIYSNTGGIRIFGSASNTIVQNNICYSNNIDYSDSGSGTIQSNNLFGIDPKFVNAPVRDFRLQDDSPAINAGIAV